VLVEVAQALLTALEFVHSKGIVHGDVKISNILIQKGKFYLADFGSSVKMGEPLVSTTISSLPDMISEDALIASEGLD
jgi:serine/threonine protein kinase